MYKTKAIITVILLALVTLFFFWAVMPAIKGGSEGYAVQDADESAPAVPPVTTSEPAAGEEAVAEVEQAVQDSAEAVTEEAGQVQDAVESAAAQARESLDSAVDQAEQAVETVTAQVEEAVESAGAGAGGLYSVVDGNKLDEFTFDGFRQYRNWCARCHGTYAQGMAGPNLADSLNVISKEEFVETVTNGKTGQIGMMPAWNTNDTVMEKMDNIYAYLKARADGAIGEVRPARQ